MATELALTWSHGRATIEATAAMLTDLEFRLPSGAFRPLARAPWLDDGTVFDGSLPGHLRRLGGEFPCVPFGLDHGHGANSDWQLSRVSESEAVARIDYPDDSPVRGLERRVAGIEGSARLSLSLLIDPRRDSALPIGVHPILRLPTRVRTLRLSVGFDVGYTYPTRPGTGAPVTRRSGTFVDLDRAPGIDGRLDLSALPIADGTRPIDDVVLLANVQTPVTAAYLDEGAALIIDWDRAILPSVNLWYTDRGIGDAPWDGRYRGLGVEPAAAWFDLGEDASVARNDLSKDGVRTSVQLRAGHPIEIRYELSARPLEPAETWGDQHED